MLLIEKGYPLVPVPRDGYGGIPAIRREPVAFFSHRHAAFLAGLGTFGIHNCILTREYGPRVRFGSVFTTAKIPSDPLMNEELCTWCMQCVLSCPVRHHQEKITLQERPIPTPVPAGVPISQSGRSLPAASVLRSARLARTGNCLAGLIRESTKPGKRTNGTMMPGTMYGDSGTGD